jgi:hypothetical protein
VNNPGMWGRKPPCSCTGRWLMFINLSGIVDGEGNPISAADIQAAIYSDPTIAHKWTDEELRQVKPGDPNSLMERQIAWRRRHEEEQRLGIPVNDPTDPYPTEEDNHTRIGLHEIDPKKPLLDDIADE